MSRTLKSVLLTAAVGAGCLLAVDAGPAAASTAHPESTKVLPRLFDTAGAVDSSGGSLVVGEHITSGPSTLEAYYRSAAGR